MSTFSSHPSFISLLSEKQAAGVLGLSIRTLQSWRLRGGGPMFVKAGRAVRYRTADLERWVEERRRESTSGTGSHEQRERS